MDQKIKNLIERVKKWWYASDWPEATEAISVAVTVITAIVMFTWAIVSLIVGAIEFLALTRIIQGAVILCVINTIRIAWNDYTDGRWDDSIEEDDEHSRL